MSATPNLPPPIPGTARPSSSFVTVLAWISIALALLGLVYGLMQMVMGLVLRTVCLKTACGDAVAGVGFGWALAHHPRSTPVG